MNEFHNYLPNAWQVDGLTIVSKGTHVKKHGLVRLNHGIKGVVVAAFVFSAAISALSIQMATSALQTNNAISTASRGLLTVPNAVESEVPVGYWPKMLSALRAAPILQEDFSIDDPPPLV